jgi:hypothetical protein
MVHTCNPSSWEAEAGGFRVQGQLQLYRETLFQKWEWEVGVWERGVMVHDCNPKLHRKQRTNL